VLSRLDAAPFAAVVGAWRLEQEVPVLARLAVDGKVRRGSGRHDGQPLLRSLPALEGTLITAAALHCQQASARFITREVGGDYLFGLKGNQSGILERAERLLREPAFPPDDQMAREKGHGRLDRRRIKRVAVRPEQIGLCGCWQVIAVRREREELGRQARPPSDQIGYYATSLATGQLDDAALLAAIRGHWGAIENGTHHRRDVSFGEDASPISQRAPTGTASVKSWCRRMTVAAALSRLRR
jgi:predicted transposase YbfD/YdcC